MIELKGATDMTLDPEAKFGIRGAGRTGAKTLEQKFALLAGLVYVTIGVVGFFVTGFNDVVMTNSDEKLLGIFFLNPFHNIVHLALGGMWLFGALVLSAPATEGLNLAIGGFYLLAAALGYLGYLTEIVNVHSHLDADNFLHLFSGLITVLFAGPLRVMRGEPAYAA
jgi:hypothetical protein